MMKELDLVKFKRICMTLRIVIYASMAYMLYFVGYTAFVYMGQYSQGKKIVYLLFTIERILDFLPAIIASNHGAAAFRSMSRSETPFLYDVSDKIKAASLWIIFGSAVHTVYAVILRLTGFMSELSVDTFKIITGVILFALVYVIEQGCRLQQESDETL